MLKFKHIHPSWVLNMDTDEFLAYNYIHEDEDPFFYLSNSTQYKRMVKSLRQNRMQVRTRLPKPLARVTLAEFLSKARVRPCIKVPGLQMSAREYDNMTQVFRNVPEGIDARVFMTLRHVQHGNKFGRFTKTLINLNRIPISAIHQNYTRTIHNPLAQVCGRHAHQFIGMDFISSILRINHYAGTRESFQERLHDSRLGRGESFDKRNVQPLGENEDLRPWIAAFVKKVGLKKAQRLLQPLQEAYHNTDWSSIWSDGEGMLERLVAIIKSMNEVWK